MMNMPKSKYFMIFFLILLFSSICQVSFAQPGDPPPPVPITGIEILLLLGGVLGIKRIIDSRKSKK